MSYLPLQYTTLYLNIHVQVIQICLL